MAFLGLCVVSGDTLQVCPGNFPAVEIGDESIVVIDSKYQLLDFRQVPDLETAPDEQAEVAGLAGVVGGFLIKTHVRQFRHVVVVPIAETGRPLLPLAVVKVHRLPVWRGLPCSLEIAPCFSLLDMKFVGGRLVVIKQLSLFLDLPRRPLPIRCDRIELGLDVPLNSEFLHLGNIRQAWPVGDAVQQVAYLLRLTKAPNRVQPERGHLAIFVSGENVEAGFSREMIRFTKRNLGQLSRRAGLHAHETNRLIVGEGERHEALFTAQFARDDRLPSGCNIVADFQDGAHVARRHMYADDDMVPPELC